MIVTSQCRSTSKVERKRTKARNTYILSSAFVMLRANGPKEETIRSSEPSHLRIPTNSWTSSLSNDRSWRTQGDYENLIAKTRPMSWKASNKHFLHILAQLPLQLMVPLPDVRISRLVAQRPYWPLLVSQAKLNLSIPHRFQLMPHPTSSRSSRPIDEQPPPSPHIKRLHHSTRNPHHIEATMVHR